jgi:DNA repair protein RadC
LSSDKSPHRGHRARVKQKFLDYGLDVFAEHEVLELLLFFALPRGDVNVLAHNLLERFGSLHEVIAAPLSALKSVSGIGDSAAMLICLFLQLERRVHISRRNKYKNVRIRSTGDAGDILIPCFMGSVSEELFLMTLDAAGSVIRCRKIQDGSVAEVNLNLRKLITAAIEDSAAAIIISHNHLSGNALPSRSDITATAKISEAMNLIGVKLIDHIVVAGDDYVSMKDSNMLPTA